MGSADRRAQHRQPADLWSRSYVQWNVAGLLVAVPCFVVGSLGSPIGGGVHTTIAYAVGLVGATTAVAGYILERRRRSRERARDLAVTRSNDA